jgi:HD-GYP domain-containing protein (c-di-GMP phosphodiesterase class II)
MGYSENQMHDLRLAALLHDVGKVGISENILGKPGRLTDQEFFLIKQHPEIGEKIVAGVDRLRDIAPVIRHHHERFDGTGYPDRLQGKDIEMNSRIISVADTFDFLRSDLSFRKSLSVEDTLQEISRSSGTQFDPDIVSTFAASLKEPPVQFQ